MANSQKTTIDNLSSACDAARAALVKNLSAANMDALELAHKKFSEFNREVSRIK